MYIKKMIIVNIVCSVLAIIRSQITTDSRIKTCGWGWIWCHFSEATMILHLCTTTPPLFFIIIIIKYPHEP